MNNNMGNKTNITYTGIGFGGLLTIVLIALKLTNFINWSWLWVTSPLWLPTVIVIFILGLIFIISLIYVIIKKE
jgi:hypothetical protein